MPFYLSYGGIITICTKTGRDFCLSCHLNNLNRESVLDINSEEWLQLTDAADVPKILPSLWCTSSGSRFIARSIYVSIQYFDTIVNGLYRIFLLLPYKHC